MALKKQAKTANPFWADRHFSPKLAGAIAQQLEQSGVVDYFQSWDQLTNWWPRALWRPEVTPAAVVIKDCDSFQDAFLSAAYASAATTKLGVAVSTDALRRGPAELLQTMLTLADATEGRAVLMLGAGELKQARPFGYKRAEGLARMEDMLRIFQSLRDSDGLIDFEGNMWKYRRAWIGKAMRHWPKVLALGGGPKLIELAVKYADGYVSIAPFKYPTPDDYAQEVSHIKRQLERAGRDPDDFEFGLWDMMLLSDDAEDVERVANSPLMYWLAAIAGRLNQSDWRREGIEPVFPDDWHYAVKLLAAQMSTQEVEDVLSRTTRQMVEKSFFTGSPKDVASKVKPYTEAGATLHTLCDLAPGARSVDDAPRALQRQIELCRLLKQ